MSNPITPRPCPPFPPRLRGSIPAALGLLFFLVSPSAHALDFGLVFSQEFNTSNEPSPASPTGGPAFSYAPALIPWLSSPLGGGFSFSLSGKISFDYSSNLSDYSAWRDPPALPELDRAELSWLPSPSLFIRLGRRRFQDPAALVASGPFDGLDASFSASGSRFSASAWYSGLLYKHTADIVMTSRDRLSYEQPLSLDDTGYFASRRALLSFIWEKPDLGLRSSGSHQSLALGLLGQFDLNDDDDGNDDGGRFHSQYLSARYGLRLPRAVDLQLDGALGMGEGPAWAVFFAGALGFTWTPPGVLDQGFNLRALYSSPKEGERLSAFIPVTSVPRGQVFSPALAGLSVFRAAYTLRPRPSLSLTGECSYFLRTDTVSFQDTWEPENLRGEGHGLGMEWYGTAVWTPLPDLALSFGGGVFSPRPGDAFQDEAGPRWKAAAGILLSL